VRQNISVGYFVKKAKLVETRDTGQEVWLVTRWEPAEISIVSVPADMAAGIGRSRDESTEYPIEVEAVEPTNTDGPAVREERVMADPITTPAPAVSVTVGEPNEKKRADDIRALCKTAGFELAARDFILGNLSMEQIAERLREARETVGSAQPASEAVLKTVGRDMSNYSIMRAIRGKIAEAEGTGKFDGLEAEVDVEMGRQSPNLPYKGGIRIPMTLGKRTLDTLTPTKGTELVPEGRGELIELLRPTSILVESGARVLPGLSGPIAFPKQTAAASVTWMPENPATGVPDGEPSLGLANLAPKTIMGNVPFTRQLAMEASIGVEAWIRNELSLAHGLAFDLAGLHGSGNNGQPAGIYAAAGVSSWTASAGTIADWTVPNVYNNIIGRLATSNADMGTIAVITNPTQAAALAAKVRFTSTDSVTMWQGSLRNGNFFGYNARATTQASASLDLNGFIVSGQTFNGFVFGNFADMYMATFGGMELVVDPYTNKKKGLIEVTSISFADVMLRHGASFVKVLKASA
jgi:HK97 family phage major capsid protein